MAESVEPRPAAAVHLEHLGVQDVAITGILHVERHADLGVELGDLLLLA